MKTPRKLAAVMSCAMLALWTAPALPQDAAAGSTASISLGGGPHSGRYVFAPTSPCVIATFGNKPPGISVVLSAEDSSLSIDVPNIDEKHASEIHVVLIVADKKMGASLKGTASTTYEIDTRPDAVLEPIQKAERANRGMTGKAKTILMTQGNNMLLSFTGATASGVKVEGEITCRRM